MLRRKRQLEEQPVTELVEEAFQLIRLAPGSALTAYYLGSLPFSLALLYFWSDMARSAFAEEHLAAGSLVLTLLFVWMKLWHAVFAQELLGRLARAAAPRWRPRWLLRTGMYQAIVQPLGLIVLPLSLPLLVALGWSYAFFANATVFAGGPVPDIKTLVRKSWTQMNRWALQSQSVLFLFKIFALIVAINLALVIVGFPFLLRTLLGLESAITRAPWTAANSTMVATIGVLTWLCVDPVLKAVYVLRCFYGESLHTGQDLRADLKLFAAPAARAAAIPALMLCCLLCFLAAPLRAAPPAVPPATPAPSAQGVAPSEIDRSIDQVIQRPEYSWRLPRERSNKPQSSSNASLKAFFNSIVDGIKAAGKAVRDFIDWSLRQTFGPKAGGLGAAGLSTAMLVLMILLAVGLLGAVIWLLVRSWLGRTPKLAIAAEPLAPAPDVADENVGADQLPDDGWVRLALDLLSRGELRLALRAYYLASLATLAAQNLITLAKFKSNRDYEREVARRGHAWGEVPRLFSSNVTVFERSWYGLHEVTPELLAEFSGNVERLKARA